MGLLSVDRTAGDGLVAETVARGVRYLVESQEEDGQWNEPHFTGTGFPGDFYIRYHLYRNYFPLMALGRYTRAARD
jgi:squalene-hopene/tetraprenyl-beta-curcumene cyclase